MSSDMRKIMNILEGEWQDSVQPAKSVTFDKIEGDGDWRKKAAIMKKMIGLTKVINGIGVIVDSYEKMTKYENSQAVGVYKPKELIGAIRDIMGDVRQYVSGLTESARDDDYLMIAQKAEMAASVLSDFVRDHTDQIAALHPGSPLEKIIAIIAKLPAELIKMKDKIETITIMTKR